MEEAVDNHRRSYLQTLKDQKSVKISSFLPSYRRMSPVIHSNWSGEQPDAEALDYVLARLPKCILETEKITFTPNRQRLEKEGIIISSDWKEVQAESRRRLMFWHKQDKHLICFIDSDSALDDLVNLLIALYLESEKPQADPKIKQTADFSLQMLDTGWVDYEKTAQQWFKQLEKSFLTLGLETTPIYFVSSNLHGLVNIVDGFLMEDQNEIFNYFEANYPGRFEKYQQNNINGDHIRVNDFLYYVSKYFFKDNPAELARKKKYDRFLGVKSFSGRTVLPCQAQFIPVSSVVKSKYLDPHLKIDNKDKLRRSKAFILNINYPLGMAAYFLLNEMLENLNQLRGIYIVGKSAILSGRVGDIQIPKVVFDEHSRNIFFLNNVFNEEFPFQALKSEIYREEKAVSVYGTFLENRAQLENYTSANFNIIEMESGPYLTAVAEIKTKKPFPENEVFHFTDLPVDLGIINYASDNPLSRRVISEGPLGLTGVEPTYLALLSVWQRIIDLEQQR